eukprot:1158314-Pelagomonas_calceolata.AAC.10
MLRVYSLGMGGMGGWGTQAGGAEGAGGARGMTWGDLSALGSNCCCWCLWNSKLLLVRSMDSGENRSPVAPSSWMSWLLWGVRAAAGAAAAATLALMVLALVVSCSGRMGFGTP